MVARVDGHVSNYIVETGQECYVSWVKGGGMLCKGETRVVATVDHYVVRGQGGVIRYADFADTVCRDPFSVVHRNACACWVDGPSGATVAAGANVDVDQWGRALEACYVDVVESVVVLPRGPGYVSVAARRRETYAVACICTSWRQLS